MKRARTLDGFETTVRFLLAIALALIAWDSGTTVVGIGALVLALIAVATAASGVSPIDRVFTHFEQSRDG